MTASEIIQIITAAATCVTAIGGLIIAIRANGIKKDVAASHVIINQQRTDMLAYQERLVMSLRRAGVDVPDDVSLNRGENLDNLE